MQGIDIGGTRLVWFEEGSGEPVVLVHGSASDYRTWHAQRDVLAEEFRVITYSRRYHWPNDPIPAGMDYSMAQHVEDLRQVLAALHAAPAHLVGHSYGGFLCLLLALEDPSLVRSLVLIEPPVLTLFVSSTPTPLELARVILTRPRTAAAILRFGARGVAPAARAFRRGDPDSAVRIFGDAVFGSGGYDRLSDARKAQVRDSISNIRAELGSGFLPLDPPRLKALHVPVQLVTGEETVGLFRLLTAHLEELLPHNERVEIPGAHHLLHEDNPAAFTSALLSFLRRHREWRWPG